MFQLLLAVNGFAHVIKRLVIDKAMAAIFFAEAICQVVLVFVDAALKVVRHSDVDHPRLTGDDVDAVTMFLHRNSHQQVPPLRIAIDEANRNAPVGMTEFSWFIA
jgi:hypothetical protein